MDERIMEAHQAYLEEKQLKLKYEKERRELGKRILKEGANRANRELCERYFRLDHLVECQDREMNYWARRVADRITEYSDNKDNP